MKATCLQENVKQALQITNRFTPGRTSLPIIQSTLIQAEGGMLHLVATNLEMTVLLSLSAEVEEEGSLAVPNKLLSDFINELPKEPVEMSQDRDNTRMKLRCGPAKANINSSSADFFPPTPEVKTSSISIPLSVEEFRKAVNRVAFCAASDNGRPVLTGVLLEVNEQELVTVGADGFRLGMQRTPLQEGTAEEGTGTRVVVPARVLMEVQRIANATGEQVEITIPSDEKHIRFRIGSQEPSDTDIEVVSTLLADPYPNYETLIPPELENGAVFVRSDLQGAIRRATIFARDDYNTVRFNIRKHRSGTRAVISSEAKDLGNNRAELEVDEPQGREINIAFNGKYMQEALGSLGCKKVRLETSRNTAPAKMTIPNEDDYVHVMMPIMTLDQGEGYGDDTVPESEANEVEDERTPQEEYREENLQDDGEEAEPQGEESQAENLQDGGEEGEHQGEESRAENPQDGSEEGEPQGEESQAENLQDGGEEGEPQGEESRDEEFQDNEDSGSAERQGEEPWSDDRSEQMEQQHGDADNGK